MAKQTYAQIQRQIAMLNMQAEKLKKDEIGEVIAKIKEAIKAYEIMPADLFGAGGAKAKGKVGLKFRHSSKSKSKSADKTAKYADGQGGEWVGRGPRPKWLRDAIAGGRSLSEFAVGGASDPAAPSPAEAGTPPAKKTRGKGKRKNAAAKKAGKAKSVAYSDGAGKQWSGRGPRPFWLKAALAAGRPLEDLKV